MLKKTLQMGPMYNRRIFGIIETIWNIIHAQLTTHSCKCIQTNFKLATIDEKGLYFCLEGQLYPVLDCVFLIYSVLCISDPVTNLRHTVINDSTVVLTWGSPVRHDTAHPVLVINCHDAIRKLVYDKLMTKKGNSDSTSGPSFASWSAEMHGPPTNWFWWIALLKTLCDLRFYLHYFYESDLETLTNI